MSRAKTLVVAVPFKDETGEFTVKCRVFTQHEQDIALEILVTLDKLREKAKKNEAKASEYAEVRKRLNALLAYPEGICLDPEINLEFFDGGNYTSDVPFYILQYVMKDMASAIQNAQLFRNH
jgi:hypothetical protein